MDNLTLRQFLSDVPQAGSYSVLADDGGNYIWLGSAAQVAVSTPTLLDMELRTIIAADKQVILLDTYEDLIGEFDD